MGVGRGGGYITQQVVCKGNQAGDDGQVVTLRNPGDTCRKRSKGRDRLGVPVRKIARVLRLTADTAASVCRASGGFSLVRSV